MVDLSPIFRTLEAQGYSPAGAAGIVGNFGQESGGNPAVIGDNGTSGGLGQWHAERFANLQHFAGSLGGDWRDPAIQVKFADHEIRQNPSLFASLNSASSPSAAADIFQNQFERPAPATANTANRERIANQVFNGQNTGQAVPTVQNAQSQFGAVGLPSPSGASPSLAASSPTAPSPQAQPQASPGQDIASALSGLAQNAVAPQMQPQQQAPAPPPRAYPTAPDPAALAASLLQGTHARLTA